jgi:hypothetical protein
MDAEPATITNLNGFVGLAYISGMVTRLQRSTGQKLQIDFAQALTDLPAGPGPPSYLSLRYVF